MFTNTIKRKKYDIFTYTSRNKVSLTMLAPSTERYILLYRQRRGRFGARPFLAAKHQGCLVYKRTTSVYLVSASDVLADLADFISAVTPSKKFYSWSEKDHTGRRVF